MERATITPTDTPSAAGFGASPAGSPEARGPVKFLYSSGSRPLAGYTIKRGIGRGGFGEVYYAESDGGKEVALKLIRRHLDVELRGIAHCLNLKHPNLLALYDVKQDDEENTWVVMEYIAGESLEQVLQRHPNGLPPAEACAWARGIAAGAAYLHNHGIVHRDLKPGNVFRDEGIVKLGDYGLSKFISCSRRSGHTDSVGTVHYMAPEVANGRYGKQIDIYALGIILYEMLTGRVPFEGESIGEVLMKHLTAVPDVSMLAQPYRSIVARALAKDPQQRFESIEEMAAALPGGAGAGGANYAGPSFASAHEAGTVRDNAVPDNAVPPNGPAPASHATTNTGPAPVAGTSVLERDPLVLLLAGWWRGAAQWWQRSLTNRIIGFVLGFIVLGNVALTLERRGPQLIEQLAYSRLFSLAILLAFVYAVYRLARAARAPAQPSIGQTPPAMAPVAGRTAEINAPAQSAAHPSAQPENWQQARRRRWRDAAAALPPKSPRQRLTELLGSMLMSAAASVVISVLLLLCRGQLSEPQQFAWLATVSTLGAWSVLAPAKLWEGKRGDAALRRFAMLVVGLGIGAAAYGCDQLLLVELPFDSGFVNRVAVKWPTFIDGAHNLYSASGEPLAGAFLVYFGLLFLMVRWWRLADPLRSTRLSLWSTARILIAAMLVNLFWPFPQPWGLMATAAVALSVQLAAPLSGVPRGEPRG